MKRFLLFLPFLFIACGEDDPYVPPPDPPVETTSFIYGADISFLPQIELSDAIFYNDIGEEESMTTTLKEKGINTIRLRLWHNPNNIHSSMDEVKAFSQRLKDEGFKIWLTLHYSDSWADPGKQNTPAAWADLSFNDLKTAVYDYTKEVMEEIEPEYIQIGNEINSGMLHPSGNISSQKTQFLALLAQGCLAVRDHDSDTKIIMHFAGQENSDWFFEQVQNIDYDIIGISYYPMWHGKSISNLKSRLSTLSQTHNKEILIAETAYPFTIGWDDWTNNILGMEDHLILPDYPASPQGQKDFITDLILSVQDLSKGIGVCYWGGEWIAYDGPQSPNGSSWENQAFYDFDGNALPVLDAFSE